MLRSSARILKQLQPVNTTRLFSSPVNKESLEDLKWFAEQPLCDKTTLPSHHDNRQWMRREMAKIKPGDYTIIDSNGLAEAYEEARNRCLPGVY